MWDIRASNTREIRMQCWFRGSIHLISIWYPAVEIHPHLKHAECRGGALSF